MGEVLDRPPRGVGVARIAGITAVLVALALALAPYWGGAGNSASAASADSRYSLVHGCFALRSQETGNYVAKGGGGYTATTGSIGAAEPFRMQATDLSPAPVSAIRYLFYGPTPDFMARTVLNGVAPAAQPSNDADWTVNEDGPAFRIVNEVAGRDLAVDILGVLTTVPQGTGGDPGLFTFEEVSGCAEYPEIEVNVDGEPRKGSSPTAPVSGLVEAHMHHMAFEFLGGGAHCGRPWHRFGAPSALVDCVDHEPNGCSAVLETAISGTTCHGTDGWPTFNGWPNYQQLTHEQSYYKWLERSWRGGLRVFVNLLVANRVLCDIYPLGPGGGPKNSCDEMDTVRLEAQRARELERYIDAQSGGPGKGWYRIVDDPVEAREVINDGKLAVILGMEVSEPFGCRLMQPGDVPMCTQQQVDDGIDELYDLGVRQLELINKFDNGLAGVAGDGGETGAITNGGNFLSAGDFWDLEHCNEPVNHDHSPTSLNHNDDELVGNALDLVPGGTLPAYGPPPHCNRLGLSGLGEHAIRRLMDKGMLFDPDHMSVLARNRALDVVESENYPGVLSSHSWSTDNALPRIYKLGGFVAPYAGSSQGFVDQWRHIKQHGYDKLSPNFSLGYGADMNGFGGQGGPRGAGVPNPVSYPFPNFDCTATIHRQQSGQQTYDINTDGVAHYGLYPDWVQDLRMLAGQDIIDDMANGAESYLQMWEQAAGVPHPAGGGSTPVSNCAAAASSPTQTSPDANGSGASRQQCIALKAKFKKAKSKKAKRKIRRKIRAHGCSQAKKKKKKRSKPKRAR